MRALNQAYEDVAAFNELVEKVTKVKDKTIAGLMPTDENRATRRERMRKEKSQAKRLAKAHP